MTFIFTFASGHMSNIEERFYALWARGDYKALYDLGQEGWWRLFGLSQCLFAQLETLVWRIGFSWHPQRNAHKKTQVQSKLMVSSCRRHRGLRSSSQPSISSGRCGAGCVCSMCRCGCVHSLRMLSRAAFSWGSA